MNSGRASIIAVVAEGARTRPVGRPKNACRIRRTRLSGRLEGRDGIPTDAGPRARCGHGSGSLTFAIKPAFYGTRSRRKAYPSMKSACTSDNERARLRALDRYRLLDTAASKQSFMVGCGWSVA